MVGSKTPPEPCGRKPKSSGSYSTFRKCRATAITSSCSTEPGRSSETCACDCTARSAMFVSGTALGCSPIKASGSNKALDKTRLLPQVGLSAHWRSFVRFGLGSAMNLVAKGMFEPGTKRSALQILLMKGVYDAFRDWPESCLYQWLVWARGR